MNVLEWLDRLELSSESRILSCSLVRTVSMFVKLQDSAKRLKSKVGFNIPWPPTEA